MVIREDTLPMSRYQDTIRRSVCHISVLSLFILLFCSTLVLPAGALQVSGDPAINPGETLVAGDEVSIYAEVIYSVSSMNEYMDLTTGLSDARWRVEILSDGRTVGEVSRSGRYAGITGFELFNNGFTKLCIHLNGTVSEGFYGSGEQTLMSVEHIAADGSTVLDTVEVTAVVLTSSDVDIQKETAYADLMSLGELIRTAYVDGLNTGGAEEAYADAEDLIAGSGSLPLPEAFAALTSSRSLIADAKAALSETMYSETMSSAKSAVSRTESLLAQYEQDPDHSSEGVMVVQSRLESAGTYLVLAQEMKNSGDGSSARSYARQGLLKAEGAYEYLISLTPGTENSEGTTGGGAGSAEETAGTAPFVVDVGTTPANGTEGLELEEITDMLGIIWGGVLGGVECIRQLADAVNQLIS